MVRRCRAATSTILLCIVACGGQRFTVNDGEADGSSDGAGPQDAGDIADALVNSNHNKVCGNSYCVGGTFCCYGAPGPSCVADLLQCPPGCGMTTTPVGCDTSAECPSGDVCCGEDCGSKFAWVACVAADKCTGNRHVVCSTQEATNNSCDCPGGATASPLSTLPGYSYCK
jgi:hypothetical protein